MSLLQKVKSPMKNLDLHVNVVASGFQTLSGSAVLNVLKVREMTEHVDRQLGKATFVSG